MTTIQEKNGKDADPGDTMPKCEGISERTVDILEQDIELEGQTITKKVNTVLVVSWNQTEAADSVKVRFTFEDDEWLESPTEEGSTGMHDIPILGVPEKTDVTIQIINETDGEE